MPNSLPTNAAHLFSDQSKEIEARGQGSALTFAILAQQTSVLRNMHVHWWDAKPTVSQTFIQLHLTSSTGDRSLPVTKVVGRPLVQGRPERSELWEAALRPEDSLLLSRNLEEGAAPQCSVDKSSEKRGTGNAPQCPSGAQEREYQHSLLLSPELGLSPLLSHPGQPL